MKHTITLLLLFISGIALSQEKALIKKIEVKGTAEIKVVPDEIYLQINLKEYKKGGNKVEMDKLEEGLVKAVRKTGISEDDLSVSNVSGYNWNWRKKKSDEFLAVKSFQLKLKNVKQINNLLEKVDSEGINSVNISRTTHSEIEKYKNELKLKALKNAKEKAQFMLEGIGEELGSALEIQEIEYANYGGNVAYAARVADQETSYQSNLNFKLITIKADVRAVFAIK